MTRNLLRLMLMTLLISACTVNLPKSEPQSPNMLDQYDRLYKSTIYAMMDVESLKKLMTLNSDFGKTRIAGVDEYRRIWCSTDDITEIKRRVFNIADTHCRELGGTMHDRWCRSNKDEPIFFASAGDRGLIGYSSIDNYCKPNKIATLVVSTSENAKPEDWKIRAMNAYHYQSYQTLQELEVKQKETKKNVEYQKRLNEETKALNEKLNKLENKRANSIEIAARGKGSRVCKEINKQSFFTGFVEQFENERMQIRVTNKVTRGIPQNDFSPILFWDEIGNWYPCDSQIERELMSH